MISVALAVAKAAANAIPPKSSGTSIPPEGDSDRQSYVTGSDGSPGNNSNRQRRRSNFDEYLDSLWYHETGPAGRRICGQDHRVLAPFTEVLATAAAPNLLVLWKGKFMIVSEPRLLVCGGCGEGRGVGPILFGGLPTRALARASEEVALSSMSYTANDAHQFVETKMHRKVTPLNENRERGGSRFTTDLIFKRCGENGIVVARKC